MHSQFSLLRLLVSVTGLAVFFGLTKSFGPTLPPAAVILLILAALSVALFKKLWRAKIIAEIVVALLLLVIDAFI